MNPVTGEWVIVEGLSLVDEGDIVKTHRVPMPDSAKEK